MWLEHDSDSGFQFLDDEEIIFLQGETQIHVATDDEDLSEAQDVLNLKDAFIALETLMAWCKQ